MNAVKNAPDYAKNAALESASKAKVGGIKDDTILMSTQTFEKAIENISGVRSTTGGGSVQTSVQNNQVVITGVTIPASNGEKVQVKADKPIPAATATQNAARFEEKVSAVKEIVQAPISVNTGKSQGTDSPNLAMINRVDQGTSNDPYKLEYFEFEGLYRPTAFTEDYTRWDEIGDNLIMSLGLPIINKKIADSGVTPNGRVLTQNEKDALYEKDKENWIDTVLFLAFSGGKGKGELAPTKIFARPIAGDNTGIELRIQPKKITRVRHYTNRKGINGIEQDGSIIAKDNNRVYVEPANKSPLSQVEAETKYQLKSGRGRDYVEFDVPNSLLEWVRNPRYGTHELTIKDGVNELKNPSFVRRK